MPCPVGKSVGYDGEKEFQQRVAYTLERVKDNPFALAQTQQLLKVIEEEGLTHEWTEYGLPCAIHRGPFGAWCGYVAVTADNIFFNKSYDELDVSVHGGLTFSSEKPDKDGYWWFGFDCSHFCDLSLLDMPLVSVKKEAMYRDKAYVINKTKNLAKQLVHLDRDAKHRPLIQFLPATEF